MFAFVCGFSLSNPDSAEGTAVGELPEAREASHQSHEEAADEGKDTT